MQVASILAGYSLGQADILRRAMGKKNRKEMDSQREIFVTGAQSKGVDEGQAKRIFSQMETFAEYGFNKSHSAAYGLIAYQTAWLKTNHPVEFMAALLTADGDNTDKVVRFIGEARAMSITVLPPSVNDSGLDFTVTDGAVRFGLGAIKGVGAGAVECVLAARDDDGPFIDLFDFTERVDLRRVNRRVLEALVKCGAFDGFTGSRQGLFMALDRAIERGQAHQRDRDSGQFNLFGELEASSPPPAPEEPGPLVDDDEWPDKIRLAFEKECLGFYVSGHPIDTYIKDIERLGCTSLARLGQVEDRSKVLVGAVVTDLRERPLKSGNGRMAFAMLEDLGGRAELLVFSKVFPDAEAALKGDEPILVEATLQHEGEGDNITFKLRAERVRTLSDVRSETARRIRIELDPARAQDEALLERLQQRLLASANGLPVEVVVIVPELGRALVRLGGPHRMLPDEDSVHALERIVGRGRVSVL